MLASRPLDHIAAEHHNPEHILVLHSQGLVGNSMSIQDPCNDLHNRLRTYYNSWVDHREWCNQGSLRLRIDQGKLLHNVVPHKPTYNVRPCRKLSHTAVVHTLVDILGRTLLHSPNGILDDTQQRSCHQRQDRLQVLEKGEELVEVYCLKRHYAYSHCVISLKIRIESAHVRSEHGPTAKPG